MVTIISNVSEQHPHKAAIEVAVRELLADRSDRWSVRIEPSHTARWWLTTIRREGDGYCGSFFVEPGEQTAEGIVRAIRDTLEHADP
jgi:hypothetical protein